MGTNPLCNNDDNQYKNNVTVHHHRFMTDKYVFNTTNPDIKDCRFQRL